MKRLLIIALVLFIPVSFWAGVQWQRFDDGFDEAMVAKNRGANIVAITNTLEAQDEAWNTGDIEAFMADYVADETLRFASGNTVEYGWQSTLDRYRRRYPDRAAMGTLSFTDLDVQVIDADDALVFGRWELERDADRPNGLFTLHMVKRDGRWLIQSDHTSSE